MKDLTVVAVRRPLWMPEKNIGIAPIIKPGDWQLSMWKGTARLYALKIDFEQWHIDREENELMRHLDYPFASLPKYALEIREDYHTDLLLKEPWIEVLAFAK